MMKISPQTFTHFVVPDMKILLTKLFTTKWNLPKAVKKKVKNNFQQDQKLKMGKKTKKP